jgi:23S rRNA (cytosine1962-C5)-methyltransferase
MARHMLNYKILDSGDFEKLEVIGNVTLIRPSLNSPYPKKNPELWKNPDGYYEKNNTGSGKWYLHKKVKDSFEFKIYDDIIIKIKLTPFGHLGIFPEQEINWKIIDHLGLKMQGNLEVLNLFAYSGISTLIGLRNGMNLCHVDASKGMVEWARENAELSSLGNKKVRWIVEDVLKFLQREVNRGKIYDGVILDPPSFGRGSKGEIWKIENDLPTLMELVGKLTNFKPKFIIMSCHTTGFSPLILERFLKLYFKENLDGFYSKELYILEDNNEKLSGGFCSYYFSREFQDCITFLRD